MLKKFLLIGLITLSALNVMTPVLSDSPTDKTDTQTNDTVKGVSTQLPDSQVPTEKSSIDHSAISTNSILSKEKLKKELDELDKNRAAQARAQDKILEVNEEPYGSLIKKCEKLGRQPFAVSMLTAYSKLGVRYYFKALASGKYQDAINFHSWLLQAYEKYFQLSSFATALEYAYLADLNSLKGDYLKAEHYCLVYLNKPYGDTPKQKSPEPSKKQPSNLPGIKIWSPAGIIDLAMFRISYAKGDYDKAAQFLAKAKATAPPQ